MAGSDRQRLPQNLSTRLFRLLQPKYISEIDTIVRNIPITPITIPATPEVSPMLNPSCSLLSKFGAIVTADLVVFFSVRDWGIIRTAVASLISAAVYPMAWSDEPP